MNPRAVAAAGILTAGLTLAAGPADEPADGYVFDAMTAPQTVSYTGTVETTAIGDQHSDVAIYRIEHRAPDLTQRLYESPPKLRGDAVLSRGVEHYFLDAKRKRAVQTENDAQNDQIARDDNYLLLRANYRAIKAAAETFAGRPVRTIRLVNKYTNRPAMIVRIDERTKLVLDKQQFSSSGDLVSETRFQEIRFSNDVSAKDFDLPKGYAIVRGSTIATPSKNVAGVVRSAGFPVEAPHFLPDGFSPVEGHVVAIGGVRTLHVMYSDGIRTVSLFENAGSAAVDMAPMHPQSTSVAGRPAQYAQRGDDNVLAWSDGRLHCALVGDLSVPEMQRIAGSIQR